MPLAIRGEIEGFDALRLRVTGAKKSSRDDHPSQYFALVPCSPNHCPLELFVQLLETFQKDPVHAWPDSPSRSKSARF